MFHGVPSRDQCHMFFLYVRLTQDEDATRILKKGPLNGGSRRMMYSEHSSRKTTKFFVCGFFLKKGRYMRYLLLEKNLKEVCHEYVPFATCMIVQLMTQSVSVERVLSEYAANGPCCKSNRHF